jgi:hypothetical protein
MTRFLVSTALMVALLAPAARVGSSEPTRPPGDAILLTIFLRHDQSRPLGELNAQLTKNGWYEKFPPAGIEVVSWYVVMGIGQVVTLRVPPDRLRDVNLAIENGGWGAYRTDFYPAYDFRPVWEEMQKKRK